MMRPKRLPRLRSGIERAPKREWPNHRKFVRKHVCVVPGCCAARVDPAHYRTAANSGKDLKPADWWCFPCCRTHHDEQHLIGQPAFEEKYGIKLVEICVYFAQHSPDLRMREVMMDADGMRA